jgi:hypothetical protein
MKDVLTVEDDPSGRFVRLNASYSSTTLDRTSGAVSEYCTEFTRWPPVLVQDCRL